MPYLSNIDRDSLAEDVLTFVRTKSETGSEGPGSEFLADLLRREGFDPVLDPVLPGRPNVVCRIPGRGDGPALMFNGHTDTIPIGSSAPPELRDGWVTGRGAEDMKGGLVAMVHAASALRRAGVRLKGDLYLTGVIGHESPVGRKEGPRHLIRRLRDGSLPVEAIIIVEGPAAIWSASLGSSIYQVSITSPLGPIHTIKVPYERNPARWVGRLLEELAALEREFEAGPRHPLCGRQQLNVGMVHGGDYMNRLPARIEVVGTWRWTPGRNVADTERLLGSLCARLAEESGLEFEWGLDPAATREPFETPADHPVVRALSSAATAVTGVEPARIGMGLVGDANLYSNDGGVPTVYYGPAHETAHSDHERVSIDRLVECAAIYATTAVEFCGA